MHNPPKPARPRPARQLLLALLALGTLCPAASAPSENLALQAPHGALGIYVRGSDRLQAGTPAALRIAIHWATSELRSGPWPGATVEARLAGGGRAETLFRGRSDEAGLVDARFVVPDWPDGTYTMTVAATAGSRRQLESHAVELVPSSRLLLESDKPLYQPTQTVHLRVVGMRPLDGKPLGGGSVAFTVSDPRGNEVFRESRPLSAFGVAAVDFALADEILTGSYRARVELTGPVGDAGGRRSGRGAASELALSVERYVLPKFKVGLETDRSGYRPGETVKLTLDARYFFGKPVAGGKATVHVRAGGRNRPRVELVTLQATLDGEGKARLEAALPSSFAVDDGTLTLAAEVVDTARHREEAARELPFGADTARLELTADGRELVPGAANRVWLAVTRPDGVPIANAAVELRVNGVPHALTTDAIGVARFALDPATVGRGAGSGACGNDQLELAAAVSHDGVVSRVSRCERVAPTGALALTTDRAIYPLGAPVEVALAGLGPDGVAYLDVIKDGQTVDTARLAFRGGHGQVTLAPDPRRFGTLALEAYRIAPDGTRTRTSRLVYVERPAALKVELHTEATYRPGEPGRLRVRVIDAQTGKGTRAEVGLVMVDQSLLALKEMKPGAARVYFTLADEATRPQLAMRARPGGYTIEKLIEDGQLDALKDEAARILFANASAPWTLGWESDPWQERKEARDTQLQRLGEKVTAYAATHSVGERVRAAHFRFRRDLLQQMIAAAALPAKDAHDPWGNRISVDSAVQAAGLGEFDAWARDQVEERLTQIYVAVARAHLTSTLPRDPRKAGAVVWSTADLERLARDGKLPGHLLLDPWGQPWHVVERARVVRVARLRSRYLLASVGPDGVAGTADDLYAADASFGRPLDALRVAALSRSELDTMGAGGLGLVGRGYGGGGSGYAYGRAFGSTAGVVHGAGAGAEARVRRDFPETLLWRPELLTDEDGNATVDVTMADSITTWRLFAEAIAADGRLGRAETDVRVFQDFFVDLDLPPTLTQHDEVAVPVAVYNYLKKPERVTLTLDEGTWFTRLGGEGPQTVDLQPGQVGVRYFRVRALGVGRHKLLVRARGSSSADAVERSVEVHPDGIERSVAFASRLDPGLVQHAWTLPDDAIADASVGTLKLYPSTATHVIEGLDSMLRMPGGCFEQTSSTTYPNALILDYLRKTNKATPELEKKAHEYLAAGWQRLLSFEVKGGGFSWFGQAPANQVLTAYGLEEFHDMARVLPIDKRVLERTQAWLVARQRSDGSWAPDSQFINEGATNHFNSDVVRISAYIAVALAHSGYRGNALDRARAFVRRSLDDKPTRDPYTLALATELEVGGNGPGHALEAVLDQLWQGRTDDGKLSSFVSKEKTPTYGDGKSGTVETTALAAFSMLQGKAPLTRVDRAIGFLLSAKDTFGNWYSTQATILSLKALLAYGGAIQPARGAVTVMVDGREAGRLPVDATRLSLASLDLPQVTTAGHHQVEVRFEGKGQVAYQLVGRWFEPRPAANATASRDAAPPAPNELEVTTSLSTESLKPGEELVETVRLRSRLAVDMPMVLAAVPPGFDVDGGELDKLVAGGVVDKIQRTPDAVVVYLTRVTPERPFTLALHLRARFPERVLLPPSVAYEYYRPERRAETPPVVIAVDG